MSAFAHTRVAQGLTHLLYVLVLRMHRVHAFPRYVHARSSVLGLFRAAGRILLDLSGLFCGEMVCLCEEEVVSEAEGLVLSGAASVGEIPVSGRCAYLFDGPLDLFGKHGVHGGHDLDRHVDEAFGEDEADVIRLRLECSRSEKSFEGAVEWRGGGGFFEGVGH